MMALARSLRIYHGDPAHRTALDRLYAGFLHEGDLAFDIGAHVGDRTSSFRRLGAKVVALEPQPGPMRVLRLLHGRDPNVTLIEAAAGEREGEADLLVNSSNPTVSTISPAFIRAADGAADWQGQNWDQHLTVPVTTLDHLIARHGTPNFIKIDVEGFEDKVLAGLSVIVPALSFEFTTIVRDVAYACLERLSKLGPYRFNLSLGETQNMSLPQPVDAARIQQHLAALPHDANSGDVYAILAI